MNYAREIVKYSLGVFFLLSAGVAITSAEILIDGDFSDWDESMLLYVDNDADGAPGGVEFDSIWVTIQNNYLVFRFRTTEELTLQDGSNIELLLDTDNDPQTGFSVDDLGIELIWRCGERIGEYYTANGIPSEVTQADIGLVISPTVSSNDFEGAIPVSTGEDDGYLSPGSEIRFFLRNQRAYGDRIPDTGGLTFTIPEQLYPIITEFTADRGNAESIRIATWNVLSDGILTREDYFQRILSAIQPDIVFFQEVWQSSEADIEERMNDWLPLEDDSTWYTAKANNDLIIASRWPILGTWNIPEARATAHLLAVPWENEDRLFAINAHPPCCDRNADRQFEIDAIMAYLRNTMTTGGDANIEEGTPFIIAGDMNLVGYRQQLITFLTGDIQNDDHFGAGELPDWDNTAISNVNVSQPQSIFNYSWRDDYSSFWPGKLDYIFYSDSQLEFQSGFVLETKFMQDELLAEYNLERDDAAMASDHIPVVADFSLSTEASVKTSSSDVLPGTLNWQIYPNPTNLSLHVSIKTPFRQNATIRLFDLLGRQVGGDMPVALVPGDNRITLPADIIQPELLSSGTYYLEISHDGFSESKPVLFLK